MKLESLEVNITADCANSYIPSETECERWINCTLASVSSSSDPIEIGLTITDAQGSAHLNQKYRDKQGPTNVLSFRYDAIPNTPVNPSGDLVICAELVEQEAKQQHKSEQAHWAHLIIHGTLHLLEYDHQIPEDAQKMETLEIKIMKMLGFPNPYD